MDRGYEETLAEPPLPDLRELKRSLWADRRRIALVFAGMFGVFALAAVAIHPGWRASSVLAVLPAPEFTARPEAGASPPLGGALGLDQIMKAETEILKSEALHARVLEDIGAARVYPGAAEGARARSRAVARFGNDLRVEASKDGNVITVAFTHADAEMAATVANVLVADYAVLRRAIYGDPQIEAVERQNGALRLEAEAALTRLTEFKAQNGIANFDVQRDQLLQHRMEAAGMIRQAEATIAEQRARLISLARQRDGQRRTTLVFREDDADARRQSLLAAVQDVQGRIDAAATRYQPGSRKLGELRQELSARQRELAALDAGGRASVRREGPNPVLENVAGAVTVATTELAAAEARRATLLAQHGQLDQALARLQRQEATIETLAQQKLAAEEAFRASSRVLEQRRLTEAEDQQRLANVRVIAPARVPLHPRPLRWVLLGAGFALALAAAAATGFVGFVARRSFLTPEALTRMTGLAVLAVVRREEDELALA